MLAFRGFHAADVALVNSSPTSCAIRRDRLVRGPEEKTVLVMVSARNDASFCEKGRTQETGFLRYDHTSVHVINAMQRVA